MEQQPTVENIQRPLVEVAELSEEQLEKINPQIAEAIRAIQAERQGTVDFDWSDFSSHKKG